MLNVTVDMIAIGAASAIAAVVADDNNNELTYVHDHHSQELIKSFA